MKSTRTPMNLQAIADLAEIADYSFAFALRAVAAVGVADHLADGPRQIADLAERTHCNAHGLIRVMRALTTKAVFAEHANETFSLQPMGDLLRSDHPFSMRWFFRLEPDVHAMAGLEHSIKTGEASFDHLFGMDYFDWLAMHDEPRERFRESQRALNRLELLAVTRSYPWHEIGSIVDIGGNDGSLVTALLQRYPTLRGTVFDLPATVVTAAATFEKNGVTDRASCVAGNVFDGGIPPGADLYNIKRVLVGFSDRKALTALTSIKHAMRPDSRLLIMEPMREAADHLGVSLDLLMLVLGRGRVRTPDEFGALLAEVGLAKRRIRSAGMLTIIEATLADEPTHE